jgi:hypothetical protein
VKSHKVGEKISFALSVLSSSIWQFDERPERFGLQVPLGNGWIQPHLHGESGELPL